MVDKLFTDGRRTVYENIGFAPGLKDTTDLIAATKTITATAEASGVGNADYSAALTLNTAVYNNQVLSSMAAIRLVITRLASRLSVTIDSDDGTHDLRCRVYVDAQDSDHMLYDLTYTAIGAQVSVQDCTSSTKATIFGLLTDGLAHTFYFFFWSPGNHSPVLSLCQLTYGVGVSGTAITSFMTTAFAGIANMRMEWKTTTVGTSNYIRIQVPYSDTGFTDIQGTSGSASTLNNYMNTNAVVWCGMQKWFGTAQNATDMIAVSVLAVPVLTEV